MRTTILVTVLIWLSLLAGCTPQKEGAASQVGNKEFISAPVTDSTENAWPETVDEAVDQLLVELSDENKATIHGMKREDMMRLHFGLGGWIRNNFGLWAGNEELLRSTGKTHPDDASGVILDALWERLQTSENSK